jgi:proline iminopeptidase
MKSLVPLERDFSVVYLDTRGAGRSDPLVKSSGYRFKNFLGDIERLRHHLGLDSWLIFAHSDASLQAMGYGPEHPRTCHGLFIVASRTTRKSRLIGVHSAKQGWRRQE